MKKFREEIDYFEDIITECEYLIKTAQEIKFEQFITNEHIKRAFVRSLEIIGEAVKKISDETKKQYPEIPWKQMAGMRDILIHEYFGVDYSVVWEVASTEIVDVYKKLKQIKIDCL